MAIIAPTNRSNISGAAVTKTTMTASDTLTYAQGTGQLLELTNTTGTPIDLTLKKASGPASFTVPGYGDVSITAGKTITVGANAQVAINLETISKYFPTSSVLLTGGVGLVAVLYS